MEWLLICLLAAGIGCVLGVIYGKSKRNRPEKISAATRWCLGIILGLLLSKALDWNWGIGIGLGLLFGQSMGTSIPKHKKEE